MNKGWKIAFFSLLAVFFAFIVTLIGLFDHYLPSVEKTDFSIDTEISTRDPIFTVSTTKQQLQPLINRKIKQYNKMNNIKYKLIMKDDMILKGAISLLGNNIEFEMKFTPKVVDNGNLILQEKSIRLGLLQLPVGRVLGYIKNSADLPEWVKILPDKQKIYIALKDIHIEDQFYLRARKFDLEDNQIKFSVYILP
ncbi:MAG TPA: YpmS family protein [Bacillales bacterium]|nr:YpmS family protein [Bacillales bacterium]